MNESINQNMKPDVVLLLISQSTFVIGRRSQTKIEVCGYYLFDNK